jgi:toxin HigB-1
MLEPCDGKLSRTVLRGERGCKAPDLPGNQIKPNPFSNKYRLTLLTYCVIIFAMIKSFQDKETEKIFSRHLSSKLPQDIQRIARKKLVILDATQELNDLRIPPGNRLEALRGDRKGQHSIRINDQWRICFKWRDGNAHDVEITDYH